MFLGIIKLKLNRNILNLGCRHRIEDCQEESISTAKVDGAFQAFRLKCENGDIH